MIGRAFRSPLVAAAYPDLGPEKVVHDDLVSLTPTRLIDLEDPRDKAFAFGHAVTRDVAYDSIPFAMRSLLHGQVGDALESETDGPDRHLDLLAYHYSRSEDVPKKRRYLLAAADAARSAYANEAAISYLEQVLPLVDDDERSGVLLHLGESLEVRGDWPAAEDAVSRAREAAEPVGDAAGIARARTATAELARQAGAVRRGRRASWPPLRRPSSRWATRPAGRGCSTCAALSPPSRVIPTRRGRRTRRAWPCARRLGDEAGVAALLTNLALWPRTRATSTRPSGSDMRGSLAGGRSTTGVPSACR